MSMCQLVLHIPYVSICAMVKTLIVIPVHVHLTPHEIHSNPHEISGATPMKCAEQHLHWLHRAASWQVHKPNPDGGKVIILRLLDEVGAFSFSSRDFQGDRPL